MRMRGIVCLLLSVPAVAALAQDAPTLELIEAGRADEAPQARIAAAAQAMQGKLGVGKPLGAPGQQRMPGGIVHSRLFAFQSDPGGGHAFLAAARGTALCHVRIPKGTTPAGLTGVITSCANRLNGGGGGPGAPAAASVPAGAASGGGEAAHPENWRIVSGVYFYRGVSIGYGGAMTMTFRPVVLFNDASYYEIDEAPLEDIDLAAERAAHPRRFGRWARQGATFTLFDDKGRGHDYAMGTGNFFKAYPATGQAGLTGSYSSVTGGGNSAVGGTTGYLADSRMTFSPDGRFTTGQSVAFSQSPAQTGVAIAGHSRNPAKGGGRYITDRYTLTLVAADGTRQRRFFCFASDGRSGAIQTSMIFVGDSGYTAK